MKITVRIDCPYWMNLNKAFENWREQHSPNKMTDEQINAAIAEACGWKLEKNYWLTPEGCEVFSWDIPDYHNDLNAMHEAEATLTGLNCHAFCEWLLDIVADSPDHLWEVLTASSRQRAEAFLRTLGKWKEVQG